MKKATCTGERQLRTRAGGWRPGRAAGSFVSAIVEGYACLDCAIRVVAAPLHVSRGGYTRVPDEYRFYQLLYILSVLVPSMSLFDVAPRSGRYGAHGKVLFYLDV